MKRKTGWLDYIGYKNFHWVLILCGIIVLVLSFFNETEGTYSVEDPYNAYNDYNDYNAYNAVFTMKPHLLKVNKKSFVQESKGEKECRRVLENTFKRPFPKSRPDFLHNSVTGKNLEIDCYNTDLQIGIEYNGRQHYEYVKGMHTSRDSFQNQCYRDNIKRDICRKNGIVLIEVPYTVPVENIETFIHSKLKERKLI